MLMASIGSFVAANGVFPILWAVIAICLIGILLPAVDDGVMSVEQQKGTFRYIPIDLLHHHPENPRDAKRYDPDDTEFKKTNAQMEHGWDYDHPASIISNDDGRYPQFAKGTYRVLVGNRRLAVAKHRKIERMPCVIVTGLSRAEEIRRLHDHAGVVGLSNAEKVEAFKSLQLAGLSSEAICKRLGWLKKDGVTPQLNTYNKFKRIAGMPVVVQKAWKAYDSGKKPETDFIPTEDAMKELEKAIEIDMSNGYVGAIEDGPRYKKAAKTLAKAKVTEVPNYSRKETLNGIAANLQEFPWLRTMFKTLAGKQTKHKLDDVLLAVKHIYALGVGRTDVPRPAIMDMVVKDDDDETVEPETTDSDNGELVAVESVPTPQRKRK